MVVADAGCRGDAGRCKWPMAQTTTPWDSDLGADPSRRMREFDNASHSQTEQLLRKPARGGQRLFPAAAIFNERPARQRIGADAALAAMMVDEPDARERAHNIAMVKVGIGQAGRFVSQNAVQLHGGMGMTEAARSADGCSATPRTGWRGWRRRYRRHSGAARRIGQRAAYRELRHGSGTNAK